MTLLKEGDELNNTYEIIKSLGTKITAETYLAKSKDKQVILLCISVDILNELNIDKIIFIEHIYYLIKISSQYDAHRYMNLYYDYFMTNIMAQEYIIIINDYIKGNTLQEILLNQIENMKSEAFDFNTILKMFTDIAEDLQYIHLYKISHNNIKPSNIMYDEESERFKLIDFDFSCKSGVQCNNMKPSSEYYMSPEYLQGDEKSMFKNDIWSIGVVFYQIANLGIDYMDFNTINPDEIKEKIIKLQVKPSNYEDPRINDLIKLLLNKNPNERPDINTIVEYLYSIKPKCRINNTEYNRNDAFALLSSVDTTLSENIDDEQLCQRLSNLLIKCNVNGTNFNNHQLIKLSKLLNIKLPESTDTNTLCAFINNELQSSNKVYSEYITDLLIKTIEMYNELQSPDIKRKIKNNYNNIYTISKKLNLLNVDYLIKYYNHLYTKYLFYSNTSNTQKKYHNTQTKYKSMIKTILDIIYNINPNTIINGKNLTDLKVEFGF